MQVMHKNDKLFCSSIFNSHQLKAKTSGGSKGGAPGAPPPMVQNFLNFVQFFGKFGKIIGRHPLPGGLVPPPMENPGSAPENRGTRHEKDGF